MFKETENKYLELPGPSFVSHRQFQTSGDLRKQEEERHRWQRYSLPFKHQYFTEDRYRAPESYLEHRVTKIFIKGEEVDNSTDERKLAFFTDFQVELKKRPFKTILINAAPIWEDVGDRLLAHMVCDVTQDKKLQDKDYKHLGIENLAAYKPYNVEKSNMYVSWGPVRPYFDPKDWLKAAKFMDYTKGFHRILTASVEHHVQSEIDYYGWVVKHLGVDPSCIDYIFELSLGPVPFGIKKISKSSSPLEGHKLVEL